MPTPRTPWTNFQIGRTDAAPRFRRIVAFTPVQSATRWFHVFSPPVRGAFQLSLTLLLCYRSRGVFRVGGMCPPSSRGISNPRYSVLRHHPRLTATGLSPSTVRRSRRLHVTTVGWTRAPHLHAVIPHGFGLPCSVFDRLYSRNHDCFLFLCLLRCFNSAGSLSRSEWPCGQEVPLGHLRFRGSLRLPGVISRLGTTFLGSRAERSPIWFVATR